MLALNAIRTVVWLAFAALKWEAIAGKAPIYSGDRRIWAQIAEAPLLSEDFFAARRPLFMPLLYKLVGGSDAGIVQVNLWMSVVAWGVFAHALSRLVGGLASVFVFTGVLLVGLSTPAHGWDL